MIKSAIVQNSRYGVKDRCLSFDGTDDYVEVPHNAVFDLQVLTIELWAKRTNTLSTSDTIIGKPISSTPTEIPYRMYFASNELRCGYYVDGANHYAVENAGIITNLNTWFHYAMVISVSNGNYTITLYRNGVQIHQNYIGAIAPPIRTTNIYIGSENGSRRFFPCEADEVRIWNHARTADQIKRYMNTRLIGNPALHTGLVAYYPMNEGTGDTVHDMSQNSNNGTRVGATWIKP
jgi:hypothetical protein